MELFKLHDGTILVYRDPQYDTVYLLPAQYTQNKFLSHLSFMNYSVYFFLVLLNSIDFLMLLIYILFVTQGWQCSPIPKFSTIVIFNFCSFSICMIMIQCIKFTNNKKDIYHNAKYSTEKSNQSIMFVSKQKIKKIKG